MWKEDKFTVFIRYIILFTVPCADVQTNMLSKCRSAAKLHKVTKNETRRLISTQEIIEKEEKYAAHNYHPLPVALSRGKGNNLSTLINKVF